jgi:hypothetical protein
MSKWTKTRRDPGRTYEDEEAKKQLKAVMQRIRELVAIGPECEPEFVQILKRLEPEMDKGKLQERVMLFRAAVRDEQQRRGR